ncbi:sulfurtransferase [Luteimonas yindakuii]|uniref:sulfurtransferase n=1 Tax=Luteimonas yindakuii TaxID=2565782 RepID=UPI0010A4F104|nr:sulfurtransferase [Luteimonas yindakuii]QCO68005.1 sulfurtransferase [Luteimonas yindakuii]
MSTPAWTALVDCDTLHAALCGPDLVVVDCRFALSDPGAGENAWRRSHVPGAVYAHLDRDLSGPHTPGAGRHPWPQAAAFAHTVAGWGIDATRQVVAYDDGDGAFAARLWCLLRAVGFTRVAVLDGGWARWQARGLPVTDAVPSPGVVEFPALSWLSLPLGADGVKAALASGGLLLDARAAERFHGRVEPIDRVAGHVPGAVNRPYADNLRDGRFKPATELRSEFLGLLHGSDPAEIVAMCGSGVTACHHLLAMAHAGLEGARLYGGSWSGWIENPSRPVATGA